MQRSSAISLPPRCHTTGGGAGGSPPPRLEADRNLYPILLSNGNEKYSANLNNNNLRHEIIWEDPFPKPCYLFALVAGKLNSVSDTYLTNTRRLIDIKIYVEKGDERYTKHAVNSLKRAMKWDEDNYGLEYDLDEYKIVAVRHFNMGAILLLMY